MFRSVEAMRGFLGAAMMTALLLGSFPAAEASAAGQRRRAARGVQNTAARPSPAPTPVVVPRLPAGSTGGAPAVTVPSQRQQQPAPQSTPAPQTSPTPAPRTQQPAPQAPDDEPVEDDEVVRVTSNLVVVPVSVTDERGEPVQGLRREDFRLEEEGRAQELSEVGDADQVPLDIAVVFDLSSSVTKNFEFEKQAAAGFLRQVLKPADRAAVFSITQKPELLQPLGPADAAAGRIAGLQPAQVSTGTAFYDTVRAATRYLSTNAPERHRRVVLVISDGEDNFSEGIHGATTAAADKTDAKETPQARLTRINEQTRGQHQRVLQKLLQEVQAADAVFYSINPSGPGLRLNVISRRAQDGMEQLASSTGGTAFVPPTAENLEHVFRQIAAELRAQYLLQYLSNNEAQPGKFLRIKVSTPARAGLRVRARQGYFKKG
ncbi:MAG TPA: VWA domain-containing protein [Pyrinomonadaceae bacterium]|nr:VWA domain-containing protein [Pyrinomonadaceae bacterium]